MSSDKEAGNRTPVELCREAKVLEDQGDLKSAGNLYLLAQYYHEALRVFTQIGDSEGISQVEAERKAYRSDLREWEIAVAPATTSNALRPGEVRLSPLGPLTRTQLTLPNGKPVVLLHKDKFLLPNKCFKFRSMDELLQVADADGDTGFVYEEEGDEWCDGGRKGSPRFNCHALAMRSYSLSPRDWLEGMESPLTNHTNPLGNMLEQYCDKVADIKLNGSDKITSDPSLQEGDILVLVGPVAGSAARQIVHSVTVKKHKGKNWTLGKMGEGPVIVAPISTLLREYNGMCDGIEVYRTKEKGNNGAGA